MSTIPVYYFYFVFHHRPFTEYGRAQNNAPGIVSLPRTMRSVLNAAWQRTHLTEVYSITTFCGCRIAIAEEIGEFCVCKTLSVECVDYIPSLASEVRLAQVRLPSIRTNRIIHRHLYGQVNNWRVGLQTSK